MQHKQILRHWRILFVVSLQFKPVGGHLLSAVSIAKCLSQRGHNVGLLVHPTEIPDLAAVNVHFLPYREGMFGNFSRALDIYRTVKKYGYNALVAMDSRAARHAGPAALRFGLHLVQVRAGGPVGILPPLRLPGHIVFSEELLEDLQAVHGVSSKDLILSAGRIDFDWFKEVAQLSRGKHSLQFDDSSPCVLAISRLTELKAGAILALLDQVEEAAQHQSVQLRIVGEGKARAALEQRALAVAQASEGRADIRFVGGFRALPADFLQADLIVGQGRTILEAIASGVPAALCGNNGYCGLLTAKTFPILAHTNLSGRNVQIRASLWADLQNLRSYCLKEFASVRRLAFEMYNVQLGAEAVERALALIHNRYSTPQALRYQLAKAYATHVITILSFLVSKCKDKCKERAKLRRR